MIDVAEITQIKPDVNVRLRQPTMIDFMENEDNHIRNQGCTEMVKLIENCRISTLNPRGCVPIDKSKTIILIEATKDVKLMWFC